MKSKLPLYMVPDLANFNVSQAPSISDQYVSFSVHFAVELSSWGRVIQRILSHVALSLCYSVQESACNMLLTQF